MTISEIKKIVIETNNILCEYGMERTKRKVGVSVNLRRAGDQLHQAVRFLELVETEERKQTDGYVLAAKR